MFSRLISALVALLATTAFAQVSLYGTVNSAGNSTLVRIDPSTGALLQTIGSVGYNINGLAFDPTTGVLYGSTSSSEVTPSRIVTINTSTGAGTLVGPTGQGQVATIAFTPSGALYGWADIVNTPSESDDLVSINKQTGAATWVGDSGLSTSAQSFAINSAGVAYLVNSDSTAYTINLSTGAATQSGTFTLPPGAFSNHHGAFHPTNGLLYVIDRTNDFSPANPRNMLMFNAATNVFVGNALPIPNNLHTLAFGPTVAASVVPVNATWALVLLALGVVGLVLSGVRRRGIAPR